MRGTVAKRLRRDIRRAMTPAALAKLDAQDEQIASTSAALVVAQDTFVKANAVTADALRREFNAIIARKFWGRFKWLPVGR